MNKKAAAVIESKYKKVIEANEEREQACEDLKIAIDNLKFEMDNKELATIKQSDIDYYAAMVQKYNTECKIGTMVTIMKTQKH